MHRLPSALVLTFALAACGQADRPWHGTDVSGHFPDLAFDLVDESGRAVSAGDYRGKVTVLFFGFTSCPGPCPATLAQLGVALEAAGPAAQGMQVLLVTVDPERDDPAALAAYADRFGPWLHGLTGEPAELDRLREAYHVAAQRMPRGPDGNYDVLHGTAVLVFDALGRCRLVISDTADPAAVAADLARLAGPAA